MNTKERTNAKFHTTWIPQIRVAFFINSLSKTVYNGAQSVLLISTLFPYLLTYKIIYK